MKFVAGKRNESRADDDKYDFDDITALKASADSIYTRLNVLRGKAGDFSEHCNNYNRDLKNIMPFVRGTSKGGNSSMSRSGAGFGGNKSFLDFYERRIIAIERQIMACKQKVQFLGDQLAICTTLDGANNMRMDTSYAALAGMGSGSLQSYAKAQSNARNLSNPGLEELFYIVERQKEAYTNLIHIVENINLSTSSLKKEFHSKREKQNTNGDDFGYLDENVLDKQKSANKKAFRLWLKKAQSSARSNSQPANSQSAIPPSTSFSLTAPLAPSLTSNPANPPASQSTFSNPFGTSASTGAPAISFSFGAK
jgi:hypothetical protein